MKVERPLPIDGQPPRITELWAWTAIDPLTDTEGIIATRGRGLTMPLITGSRELAETVMRAAAERAMRDAGEPRPTLRLRRFVPADED